MVQDFFSSKFDSLQPTLNHKVHRLFAFLKIDSQNAGFDFKVPRLFS